MRMRNLSFYFDNDASEEMHEVVVEYNLGGWASTGSWSSFGGDAELDIGFLLFLGERAEEINLLFAGRLPLVVGLKSALEMRFDVHVERLWLYLRVGRIVDTRHCLCRR